jgi:TonB family protein
MAKRGKYIGIVGTLLVYAAIIALLVSVKLTIPKQEKEESDITLMVGDGSPAYGGFNPKTLVDVDIQADLAEEPPVQEAPEVSLAEQEQQEKEAVETAAKQVAGAFGKNTQPEGKNTGDTSKASSSHSNDQGYGTFDLNGRSIGEEGLPRPQYNIQEEGKVVVTITVNPAGIVTGTSINRQTNTVNPILRKAAEEAARKARFNAVEGVTNQIGTIIYYFNLR